MSNNYLFINNSLVISQNTNIYGKYYYEGTFDYTFLVNVYNITNNNITNLFSTYTLQDNMDLVNVNLIIKNSTTYPNWNTLVNNTNIVSVQVGNSNVNFSSFLSYPEPLGARLLEVVAHKLFGHAQARAAIKNDSTFYTNDALIWDHLSRSVSTDSFAQDIFKQYVALNRYDQCGAKIQQSVSPSGLILQPTVQGIINVTQNNPVTIVGLAIPPSVQTYLLVVTNSNINAVIPGNYSVNYTITYPNNQIAVLTQTVVILPTTQMTTVIDDNTLASASDVGNNILFNFAGFTFDFPLFVSGNILLDASLTQAEKNALNNGPNIGGTLLANGSYNVPILVKFTC